MNVWSVRQLTDRIKHLLEGDLPLAALAVKGEISNFSRAVSGHWYFVLKDEHAQVPVVMFKLEAGRCRFTPENGMKVTALGRVAVYPQRGQYQLVAAELQRDGLGALYQKFLELKERLQKEGLFEPARKRPIHAHPRRVGLVTSPHGAALHDMLTTM